MNLLVDANLSPSVAAQLRDVGYDAVHVADAGLATATDLDIVEYADDQDLVIVTVDTDFPMLLALRRTATPSVVLLRGVNELAPDDHATLLTANLPTVLDDLETGAIVSLGPDHLRVRSLPLA